MSSNLNNGLIGFLTKKSLFTTTPNKLSSKRSNSKQKKTIFDIESRLKNKIDTKSQISQINLLTDDTSQNNINQNKINLFQSDRQIAEKNNQISSAIVNGRFNKHNIIKNNLNLSENTKISNNIKNPQNSILKSNKSYKNLWTGLVKQVTNFQSVRIQSIHCLQQLSIKINNQISRINYKIQTFNHNIYKVLNVQFKNMKEKINKLIDQTFKQSQKTIKQYIKEQQNILAKDFLLTKKILQKQSVKVQALKDQITSPAWRKAAGQLLSTQLEQKIQKILKQSKMIQIPTWDKSEIFQAKLYNQFENNLKSMVRIIKYKQK